METVTTVNGNRRFACHKSEAKSSEFVGALAAALLNRRDYAVRILLLPLSPRYSLLTFACIAGIVFLIIAVRNPDLRFYLAAPLMIAWGFTLLGLRDLA